MHFESRTHGLWAHTAPPPFEPAALEGRQEADVAIVGGGYTGLSAALHLAEQDVAAVLLEARQIGFGGAGRNVGLVNAGLWLMPEEVIKILGAQYGEQLLAVLGASPDLVYDLIARHGIECEAMHRGTLHCAHSPSGYRALRQREAQWRQRGAPVKLLGRDAAAARIGSTAFHGALFDGRAGTVQPLAYAYGLAGAARRAGARLYEESPVTAMRRQNDRWLLRTPAGELSASAVIVAVQGYAERAFQDYQAAMVPFNFFQFATHPLPEAVRRTILPGGEGAWDTATVLSSYRVDQAGRLIVGSVGQAQEWAYGLHEQWARRTIRKVFPQVGDISMAHGWHGCIAMTPDHVPRFHVLDRHMAMVTSYNGRGIGPGTMFGRLLADYIRTGDRDIIPLPLTKMTPVAFRALRGWFYETGARAYHMLQRRI